MDKVCGTNMIDEKFVQGFGQKTENTLGRPTYRPIW
jgi:hypothetical protein